VNGVSFWKKVGIVCSGMLALLSVLGLLWTGATFITAKAWAVATRPIVVAISEERHARIVADSLIILKIEAIHESAVQGH
jgi:anaerobic C4-dicarboxylate transporter